MRIQSLSSLRFFAAFHVVLFHYLQSWFPASFSPGQGLVSNFILLGYSAVPFFFLLSGFVLTLGYQQTKITARLFWLRRFFRLYPVLFLSLCIGAFPLFFGLKRELGSNGLATIETLKEFGVCGSLLSAWFPSFGRINYPIWSLSVEAFFYAIFPLVLPLSVKDQKSGWLFIANYALLIGFIAASLARFPALWNVMATSASDWPVGDPQSTLYDILEINPLMHLPSFLGGILLARIYSSGLRPPKLIIGLTLVVTSALAIFLCEKIPYIAIHSGLFLPLSASLIWLAIESKKLRRLLEASWLILLGESSYALYIVHVPLRDFFSFLWNATKLNHSPLFPLFAVAAMGLVVIISLALFKLVESPIVNWWRLRERAIKPSTT